MNILTLPVEQRLSTTGLLGGKAANLNRLMAAGFSVPAGIVITTKAYQTFVKANHLQPAIQSFACGSVSDVAVERQFLNASMPASLSDSILEAYHDLGSGLVAVRSSATAEDWQEASFAGQQESYLDVQGDSAVLEAVKKCWASLWLGRALAYRSRYHIQPQQVSMAVLLQPMISADCAGVLFTRDPLDLRQDAIVIEAVPGLGHSLVSGAVTPDRYLVNRHSHVIEQVHAQAGQPILSSDNVQQLAAAGTAAADLFGSDQDIEWAIDSDQLYLLQSRAITTKAGHTAPLPPCDIDVPGDDHWLPEEEISHEFDLWTRANFGEVLPNPITPLTLSSFQMIGEGAEVQITKGQKVQMVRRLYGRIYANEGGMRQVAADLGLPTSFIDTAWGSRRPDLPPKAGFRPLRLLATLPRFIARSFKSRDQSPANAPKLPKNDDQLYKQINEWTDNWPKQDLSTLSDLEIWQAIQTIWEPRRVQMYQRHVTVSSGAFLSFAPLEWMTRRWGSDPQMAQTLISGLSGVYSAQMGPALQRIAQALCEAGLQDFVKENAAQDAWNGIQTLPEAAPIREAVQQFLDKFGHRCPSEPEISLPRWADEPEQVIALAIGYISLDPAQHERLEPIPTQQAQQTFEKQIDPLRRALFHRIVQIAKNQVRRRDNSRHFMAKLDLPRRRLFITLGHRLQDKGVLASSDDIFFLTHREIDRLFQDGEAYQTTQSLIDLTAERRKAYSFWFSYPIPEAVDSAGMPLPNPPLAAERGLQGVPASGGSATGPVRIIYQPGESARLQPGDILVTLATDPGWTPLFPIAAGLILEYGGQLSHGAIVAREYGVPAVVNAVGATSRLKEGMVVTVDGSSGRIYW